MTRADFDAWVVAQPRVHQVPGAEHALWVRWCAETLARGHRIEVELPPLAPPPAAFDDALPPIAPQTLLALDPDPDGPLVAYTDGSGTIAEKPCGAGVVIFDGGVAILEASRFLGLGTNNRAELTEAARVLARAREDFIRLRETWLSRARSAAPPRAELPCLHCARARGRGEPVPCAGCLAAAEGAATP